ncbi:hypothetical protein ACIQVK_18475 [Streptomyces sp. NPDC090493]|uniref:hypothetical protein n=1 Tax=Streptomyces sp. NPDC090493 TaxID=3365964 RepID=UPI00382260DD
MDMVRFETCVSERVHLIQLAVRDVLDGTAANGMKCEAGYLRKQAADRPPRYRTADEYRAHLRSITTGGEGQ